MTRGDERLTRRGHHPMRKLASVARREDEFAAELRELSRIGDWHAQKGVLQRIRMSVDILNCKYQVRDASEPPFQGRTTASCTSQVEWKTE